MLITIKLTRQVNLEHFGTSEIQLDIEEYLKGVVGSEIGNASLEACRAQAVAARTFALIRVSQNKAVSDQGSKGQAYTVSRNSISYANAVQAVEDTKGQVLFYNDKLITTCSYSNSNGGRIKSAKEVWGSDRAWLQAKDDPYDNGLGNGHGVGMSQTGAKEMARQGFDYKQILSFYYPGTVIIFNYGGQNKEPEVIKVAYQAKVTANSGNTVNMRLSPSTSAKVVAQVAVGQVVDVISAADEWSTITWNGKSGYMMTKYLKKVDSSEDNRVWYVRIECDSETQAKALAKILAKAQATN